MFRRFQSDVMKYFRYSVVSAQSQLKAEVANSYLNWIWWVLEPFCFMLIYTFMYGYVFGAREQFFPVFIFIGLSMWNFFNQIAKGSVKIVKANKSIVSKVYLPKYILGFTKVWVSGFKMMISFAIIFLMMIVYRIPISLNVLFFFPILLTLGLLSFGCGCYLMHFGVYVEDLSNVIDIVLKFLFYLTGIFYHVENKIPVYGSILIRANPLAFLMTSMRQCLIYSETPDLALLAFWLFFSLLLAAMGIRKIYKEENSYLKAI